MKYFSFTYPRRYAHNNKITASYILVHITAATLLPFIYNCNMLFDKSYLYYISTSSIMNLLYHVRNQTSFSFLEDGGWYEVTPALTIHGIRIIQCASCKHIDDVGVAGNVRNAYSISPSRHRRIHIGYE